MNSFRSIFAPIISKTIQENPGKTVKDLRRILKAKWRETVRNNSNSYMVSEWSREVGRQLTTHSDSQRPIKELPLFINCG